ncbi:MAG: TonB C-terminal domain-containing protein [Sulfurovum sp.]|uniref:TonB C-terminal domain-containing protein n=1 Tax=Sulfurovum sp. TaxID=1969726 RepID=UPI0028680435|nr:TonB C-terminal domain-containing protein [Sulfurovum sp.]MCO4845411.1 TonB C-terminal domain-containing protein [Sulfurovum sp.]
MNNKSSTFISGVLAFGIYFTLIIILLFYFNTRDAKKSVHYVKKNENSIRISMSSPKSTHKKQTKKVVKKKPKKIVRKKEVVKKKVVKKKVIKEKIVKKVKTPKKKKDSNTKKPKKVNKPKDLFANVSTSKKVRKQKVPKPKVSASELFTNSIKVQKPSDRGIENAYFSKVEEKLKGWPAQSEYAGEKAKVWIKVEPSGAFKFKVITASGSEAFNSGLMAYLKQLQTIGFGQHKGNRAYELDVEFIATE